MLYKTLKLNNITRKINWDVEKTDNQEMSPGGDKETSRNEPENTK